MNRPNSNSYISYPVGIVDLVANNFLIFFISLAILANTLSTWDATGLALVGTILLSNLLIIGSNYSSVKGNKSKITLSSISKSITLNDIIEVKAWWCYDLSGSASYTYSDIGTSMKQSASKMNCIVKFSSTSESIYILEEIHLGDKFPNHLPYSIDDTIEEDRTLRVWDIDNCLSALGIRL